MYGAFTCINKFLSWLLLLASIVVFLIVCLSFSLITTKHAAITDRSNGFSISIQDIKYSFGEELSHITLHLSKIKLHKPGLQVQAVSTVSLYFNINILYHKLKKMLGHESDEAVFSLIVEEIDADAVLDFFKNHWKASGQAERQNEDSTIISHKILSFFDKHYIRNLKVDLKFKTANLRTLVPSYEHSMLAANAINLNRVLFSTAETDGDHLGSLKIYYDLNHHKSALSGLIVRQKADNKNAAGIQMQLYGYANNVLLLNIQEKQLKINPNDFFNLSLSYDRDRKDLLFSFNLKQLTLTAPMLLRENISVANVNFAGTYRASTKKLVVDDFSVVLSHDGTPINFSGTVVKEELLELSVQSPDIFDSRIIYDYWPKEKAQHLRERLDKLVTKGQIKDFKFLIRRLASEQPNPALFFNIEFKLFDATLAHQSTTHYYADCDEISVKIDSEKAIIKSAAALLDKQVNLEQINLVIPFKQKSATLAHFTVATSGSEMHAFSEKHNLHKGNNFFGDGIIHSTMSLEIPHKEDLRLQDIMLSGDVRLTNFTFNKYKINTENLLFSLNNNKLKVKGDISCDDVDINKLRFAGAVVDEELKTESASFKLPLKQQKIIGSLERIQLKLEGEAAVKVDANNRFNIDLSDVAIIEPNFVNNHLFIKPQLNFTYENNAFKDINLQLADLIISNGSVALQQQKIQSAELFIDKFRHSKFHLSYRRLDQNNHEYNIDATTINLSDFKSLMNNTHPKAKDKEIKQKHLVKIKAQALNIGTVDLLKDLQTTIIVQDSKLKKIDGETYLSNEKGYVRVFFDEPIVALIANNMGYLIKNAFEVRGLKYGNLSMYGQIDSNTTQFHGDLYLNNFQLLESYLLSTILRIYALSGFSVQNIFQMLNTGIHFSEMHCRVTASTNSFLFDKCQASSNAMLLSLSAKLKFAPPSGLVQGLVIPKNFFNTPIILLQKILSRKSKSLLDNLEDRQNFTISWKADEKPVIQTNPISFLLPTIFSNIFSKKKTIEQENP